MVAHKDNYLITSLSHSPRLISFYLLLITVINLGAWGEGKRGRRRYIEVGGWKRACLKLFSFLLLLSRLLQCASLLLSPSLPLSSPTAQSASLAVLISPFHLPTPPILAPSLAPRQNGALICPDSEITPVQSKVPTFPVRNVSYWACPGGFCWWTQLWGSLKHEHLILRSLLPPLRVPPDH